MGCSIAETQIQTPSLLCKKAVPSSVESKTVTEDVPKPWYLGEHQWMFIPQICYRSWPIPNSSQHLPGRRVSKLALATSAKFIARRKDRVGWLLKGCPLVYLKTGMIHVSLYNVICRPIDKGHIFGSVLIYISGHYIGRVYWLHIREICKLLGIYTTYSLKLNPTSRFHVKFGVPLYPMISRYIPFHSMVVGCVPHNCWLERFWVKQKEYTRQRGSSTLRWNIFETTNVSFGSSNPRFPMEKSQCIPILPSYHLIMLKKKKTKRIPVS